MGVVQLVRAPDCGSGGRGFEPLLPPPSKKKSLQHSDVAGISTSRTSFPRHIPTEEQTKNRRRKVLDDTSNPPGIPPCTPQPFPTQASLGLPKPPPGSPKDPWKSQTPQPPNFRKTAPVHPLLPPPNHHFTPKTQPTHNTDNQTYIKNIARKAKKYFASSEKVRTFAPAFETKSTQTKG